MVGLDKIKDIEPEKKVGKFFLIDYDVVERYLVEEYKRRGIVLMKTGDAIGKYPEIIEKFEKKGIEIPEKIEHGYFLYVPKGVKVDIPTFTCFYIKNLKEQRVVNLIYLEENSKIDIITGCATAINETVHIGETYNYLEKNSELTFTMIHTWEPETEAKPITRVFVDEGGRYYNFYINIYPIRRLKMKPIAYLERNAFARFDSVIYGRKNSRFEIGARIEMLGKNSIGEIYSRAVLSEESSLINELEIEAKAPSRGHIDCKAIMLSDKAYVRTIPVLESHVKDAILTHEAAVGKISKEQMEYLLLKGFSEEEAQEIIIKGFLSSLITKVPDKLKPEVQKVLDRVSVEGF